METQKLRVRAEQDGTVRIKLPESTANQELDVVLVFQPVKTTESEHHTPENLGYSHKFLEEVIGSWEGEAIERPEQLPLREVEDLQWPIS